MLNVSLYDERSKNLLYRSTVDLGDCQIPLRGASYGAYLRGTLNVIKGGKDRRAGEVFGTVAMGTVKPESSPLADLQAIGGITSGDSEDEPNLDLWRQYAQTGELDPPELLVYPPYNNCYLVVKVVRCCELRTEMRLVGAVGQYGFHAASDLISSHSTRSDLMFSQTRPLCNRQPSRRRSKRVF